MDRLSGKRLTVLAAALMALAAAAAVRVAAVDGLVFLEGPGTGARAGGASPDAHVSMARAAERNGDVAAALSHYRAAASLDPRCVDRRSPGFLGAAFEENLKRWLSDLKSGRTPGGATALRDASYLFRRMYGGCG